MAYVLAATWRAKEGEEERIREILETTVPLSREEPGCQMFVAHRSIDDPRVFFLYEQYDDEAAVKAHTESEHFQKHVLADAVPRLESRERAFYLTLD
jgi:quinol monooxygenase YgiN